MGEIENEVEDEFIGLFGRLKSHGYIATVVDGVTFDDGEETMMYEGEANAEIAGSVYNC